MTSNTSSGSSAGVNAVLLRTAEPMKGPNVVGVGEWLSRAKAMRKAVTAYAPRHRAAGPAV
jgi:hypothetical protein